MFQWPGVSVARCFSGPALSRVKSHDLSRAFDDLQIITSSQPNLRTLILTSGRKLRRSFQISGELNFTLHSSTESQSHEPIRSAGVRLDDDLVLDIRKPSNDCRASDRLDSHGPARVIRDFGGQRPSLDRIHKPQAGHHSPTFA